jgi:hypothetical protein
MERTLVLEVNEEININFSVKGNPLSRKVTVLEVGMHDLNNMDASNTWYWVNCDGFLHIVYIWEQLGAEPEVGIDFDTSAGLGDITGWTVDQYLAKAKEHNLQPSYLGN